MAAGEIIRLSGPTVAVRGLPGVALNELVLVGEERLLGEVVRIERGLASLQVYEDTTGLRLGEPAVSTGEPLTVELGPGLLGGIFDGVQRPLTALAERWGDFVWRGLALPALDRDRRYRFEPAVQEGAELAGGELLGTAVDAQGISHRVLCPPDARGRVRAAHRGEATVTDAVVELDGGRTLTMIQRWPVRRPRPVRERLAPDRPFLTGQRVLDFLFPLAAGSSAIVPGGFGTGKTVLEHTLARYASADVIVYVGCGERGNEMADVLQEFPRLVDPRSGASLMRRTVLVANTSNMPVAAREASIYTGMTIAEYFRDQGLAVGLMLDSTSRWAEALREISARLEEIPAEEGYPTYLALRLEQFYERSGRARTLGGAEGTLTAVGAVSPPGADFSEPVTQASLRVAGALWALSTDLAHRRHYPAVDWTRSFSLDAAELMPWFSREAGPAWGALRERAMRLLQREREIEELAQLVGIDALPDPERVTLESARLLRDGLLRQAALYGVDASCPPKKTLAMLELLLHFEERARGAVERGVPAREVLESGLSEQLVRLGELAPATLEQRAPGLRAAIDDALRSAG